MRNKAIIIHRYPTRQKALCESYNKQTSHKDITLKRKKITLDILNESVFPKLGVYWFAHNDLLRYSM